jgi:thiamine kinase
MSISQITTRELGKPIAVGGTAEVYYWDPGWVLKLYFDWCEPGIADFERRIASAVCATGLPIPTVGEIIHVNGRMGLLYENCNALSMDADIKEHFFHRPSHARKMAELHAEMHAKPMKADISSTHRRLEQKIRDAKPLPENLRDAALKALETMPDGDRLCHGDFHPGNILLGRSGPVIIDWIDSSIGSPLADVARTSIMLLGAATTVSSIFLRKGITLLHTVYLRRYFQLRPGGYDEYHHWLPIVAAGRLNEGIDDQDDWLLVQAGKLL